MAEENIRRHVLSVLVYNRAGVLSRVSGLFSRRGYNIDSFSVGETIDPSISRMTIVVTGDDYLIEQITKQIAKQMEVISVQQCNTAESVMRALALVKVEVNEANRPQVLEIANIYRARIVDVALDSVIIEVTGSEDKIESLIRLLKPVGIKELARTGLTAMGRGGGVL
jgi:acetolactate synthase-1/3 small subunit